MATSVTLPALGESVTEGTVTRWLKQPGEQVQADEPLLEVSTDKVDTEIPSPASGTLLEIKVAEDETVEVGTELAVIGEAGEGDGSAAPQESTDAAEQAPGAQAPAEQTLPQQAEQAPTEQAPPQQAEQAPAVQTEQPSGPQAEPAAGSKTGGTSVTLPALGESVTEGTVTRWLKQVGDQVQTDEPLLEISTDKVDTEIPSPASGTLLEIKVAEDETVEVGAELAVIGSADAATAEQPADQPDQAAATAATPATTPEDTAAKAETSLEAEATMHAAAEAQSVEKATEKAQQQAAQDSTPPAHAPEPAAEPAAAAGDSQPEAGTAPAAQGDGSPYVTPLVRKLAAEHSVDLATLTGTGVGGRIRKQDVLAAAEQARKAAEAPAPAPSAPTAAAAQPPSALEASALRGTTEKLSRMRAVIAKRMVESLQTSAQLTTVVEVDVSAIARLRQKAKAGFEARESVKLSFLPFFAKAAVEALKAHPKLNATVDIERNEVTYLDAEHLGVAVDTERGLLVPVIHNAGDLNIAGLARKIADLAERTRANKISPDELSGGTFTLTNTGSRGALFDTPIINQPQVAILGTGAVVKRPTVVTDDTGADNIAIRSMVYLALTYDHRLVDGADAARYLTTVKQRLERGQFEGDLGI
ncbi:MAG TPA: 2-oxoglutarate dehydrogenase, E2 component, dihydrolipoamide succinyltransferase [Jiangellaceae bacterium]|jgi:2-oxoglutarate dehydrogenase E2 component (dihydrolipoamide succinyltransferase)|nr:2-oxoglutarate dehydrogenase, E2 component, dihydrolipoamide succinyltransferase [Jiangellaceae bacterium]